MGFWGVGEDSAVSIYQGDHDPQNRLQLNGVNFTSPVMPTLLKKIWVDIEIG